LKGCGFQTQIEPLQDFGNFHATLNQTLTQMQRLQRLPLREAERIQATQLYLFEVKKTTTAIGTGSKQ